MTSDHGRRYLEICVDSIDGVQAAIRGGADRIELCSALDLGGLTPSAGLVDAARAATRGSGVTLFAMVRARAGDFAYDTAEIAMAIADAAAMIAQGVDGLVFGAVRRGQVDVAACRRWIADVRDVADRPLPCTFHRAIDMVADPVAAVSIVTELGFAHILTSGGALSALDGATTIRAMVAAAGSVQIMAGAGVTAANAAALLAATGAPALHASARVAAPDVDPRLIKLGFANGPRRHTDAATVAALRSALDNRTTIGH